MQRTSKRRDFYFDEDHDLEQRMQEAIRRSGKSLEHWISDILSEKEKMRPDSRKPNYRQAEMPDDHFHDSYGNYQHESPDFGSHDRGTAVYGDLANRVRLLEQSLRAEHAASLSGPTNYDEDARALIEGIRLRQNYSATDEQTSDRLMEMLNKINDFENKLEDIAANNPSNSLSHSKADYKDEQFERLENQLKKLEDQLQEHHQNQAEKTSTGPKVGMKKVKRSKGVKTPKGRDAFQKAMQSVARKGDFDAVQEDENSSAMIGRSHAERRAVERQFAVLMHKMDEVVEKSTNSEVLKNLQEELAHLSSHVSQQDVLPALNKLQESVGGDKLDVLESDINRIAEFLLKSPDLTTVPDQVTAITHEIGRLSDSLLETNDKNSSALTENRHEIVKDLEASLTGLRNEILAQVKAGAKGIEAPEDLLNANTFENRLLALGEHIDKIGTHVSSRINDVDSQLDAVQSQLGENFDVRLSSQVESLRKQIGIVLENVSQKIDGVEETVSRASERLEALGNARYGSPEIVEQLTAIENRLVTAAQRLEKASFETVSDQAGQALIIDAVSRDALKEELDSLASRFGQYFENNKANTVVGQSSIEQFKGEFSAFESRLETLLKSQFDSLPAQQTGLNQQDLEKSVEVISQRLNKSLVKEQSHMIDHIDQTMVKLHDTLKEQHKTLKTIAEKKPSEQGEVFTSRDYSSSSEEFHEEQNSVVDDVLSAKILEPTEEESLSPEELMLKRMREHVKARKPDDTLILPGEQDRPLAPGAGKPDLMETKSQEETLSLSVETIIEPIRDEMSDLSSVRMKTDGQETSNQKSKSDFIAAARRAAQAAASEQAALSTETSTEASNSKLAMLRERLASVTKIRRKSDENQENEKVVISEPSFEENHSELSSSQEKDAIQLDDDEILQDLPSEENKSSNRTKLLTIALIVAIFGSGYVLLREPVTNLLNGLNEPPASLNAPLPEKPAQELPSSLDNKNANEAPLEETIEVVPEVQTNLSPLGKNTEQEIAAVDQSFFTIDENTTTQAIRPDNIEEQPVLNPVIAQNLASVPQGTISTKLKAALLESDPSAYLEMARRYSVGDLVQSDLKKAAFWYEQAALKGHGVAQFRLGTLFEEGIGIAKSSEKAREWYEKAAQNGNARAMHNLAVLNTEGAFGNPDFVEAFKWFERAANYGVKDSQFNLGILYVRGLGTPVSLTQAYKWFDIVAKGGDVDAAEKRDDIAKALNAEQLKNAQNESQNWKKNDWIETANIISPNPDYWRDGTEKVQSSPPVKIKNPVTSSNLVKETQILLNGLGFDAGKADGVFGNQTKKAVRSFEYELGLPQTGKVNKKLLEILKAQKI